MRKAALLVIALGILSLVIAFYPQWVEKPVKDGEGPLAVYVNPGLAAPEYHSPLEWWQLNHQEVVNRGDMAQADCLQCHDPLTSCDNCHNYVGAKEIALTP
jgi:hypothetical protein